MPAILLDSVANFFATTPLLYGDLMHGILIRATVLTALLALFPNVGLGDHDMPREPLPKSWKLDAELTDVCFLNTNLGWAVGAQGVILRTTDGGKNWNEISQVANVSPTSMALDQKILNMRNGVRSRATGIADGSSAHLPIRCRFESVCFVDEKHGWIAGGYEVPYVGRSRAVVMRTIDGGLTWNAVNNLVVPRFNRIQFSDALNGWAIGKTGNLFQTGIVHTSDGGHTWSSQSSRKMDAWTDAEQTPLGLITIDYSGKLGVVKSNKYERSVIISKNPARVSQVRMVDEKTGWAVGENGTVLRTENGGLSWSDVEMSGFAKLAKKFDFRTISLTDSHVWIAGDPGTFLFSIDLETGKASAFRTPSNTRINRVQFIDEQSGWAVGMFGSIIATADGGQSWKVQRGGNRRTAILCVAPEGQSLPLEALSKYATEESQVCVSMILSGTEMQNQAATQACERLGSAATVAVDSVEYPANTGPDRRRNILEKIVRSIRMMRPNVIICNSGHVFSNRGTTPTLNPVTLIQDAIQMASNEKSFPDQTGDGGLNAWQVDRLAILDPTGTVTIDPLRLLPRTGSLIEDQIALSRGLTGQSVLVDQPSKYRVTHFTNRDRMRAGNLLSGLDPRKSVPTRDDSDMKRGNLGMIQQANAKQKKFEQFIAFSANTPQDLKVWRQQILSFAMKMEQEVAGVWLMQLAERYLAAGKTELAANTSMLLVTHWSDHAFAPASLTWLIQYYGSEEFAQIEFLKRVTNGQLQRNGQLTAEQRIRNEYATTTQTIQQNGSSVMVWVPTRSLEESGNDNDFSPDIALASSEQPESQIRPQLFDERLKFASQLLAQLGQRDPVLAADPQYKLLEARFSHRLTGILSNEGRYKSLASERDIDGFGIELGAQRELGIGGLLPESSDPLSLLVCQKTEQRPKLDGMLDEPFWQSAIISGNVATPTVHQPGVDSSAKTDLVAFAYDDEHLYAAFRCQKIAGQYYNSRRQPRPRDADLRRRDRVELVFDIDRDYRSANCFIIDHRGWVQESCTGGMGWNPNWYVSQSEDETTWTVEIAIPLSEIIPTTIEPDSTWAFKVARRGYHPNDLWDDPAESSNESGGSYNRGIQTGLRSRPADFELIRFEDVPSRSDAADETTKLTESEDNRTKPGQFFNN